MTAPLISNLLLLKTPVNYFLNLTSPFHRGEDALSLQRWFIHGHSHRAKHLRLQDEPLCISRRKPPLWLLKRRDGNVIMMKSVCLQGFSQVSSCQSKPADSLHHFTTELYFLFYFHILYNVTINSWFTEVLNTQQANLCYVYFAFCSHTVPKINRTVTSNLRYVLSRDFCVSLHHDCLLCNRKFAC